MRVMGKEINDRALLILFLIAIALLYAMPLGFVSKGYGDVKVIPVDENGNVIGIKGMPVQTCFRIPCIKKYTNEEGYALFTHLPSPKDPNIKFKFTVNCPGCWGFSQENCYIHVEANKVNVLYCKLSGSEPEDGEMKCTEVGPHRYNKAKQRWELVEECGSGEECQCVSKFECKCVSFCVAGWKCKATNVRGYLTGTCEWRNVQPCPQSTPYCYEGECVECIYDSHCDDGLSYTEDRCENHKCVHIGAPPTTTTTTVRPTTTIAPTTTTTTTVKPTTTVITIPPVTTVPSLPSVAVCTTDEECDDGDPCTLDKCVMGECTHIFQDKDNDGICDALDKCPEEYGSEEYDGCPAPPFPWIWVFLGVVFIVGVIIIALIFKR
ncbi:MAG TPA: hypothetical protein ENF58_02035 [Candidatus Altiarchaeales archaeon]|nr:MAG: hypothetical protein DRP23_01075 [Thermotogota bacterium]HDI72893.1 hypothetical protein [Candidatus Altiarchaeales archaeon]